MARTKLAKPTKLVARARRDPPAGGAPAPAKVAGTASGIPRAPFERLVRELIQERNGGLRVEGRAVDALHEASEELIVTVLATANRLAEHAGRETLSKEDLELARAILFRAAAAGGGSDEATTRDFNAMKLLVREIAQDFNTTIRFGSEAMRALVSSGQDLVADLFRWARALSEHAGRKAISVEDVRLAGAILLAPVPTSE